MRKTLAALAALLLVPALLAAGPGRAEAHGAELHGIKIGHAWAKPSEGPGAAIHMPLLNERDTPMSLTGAETPAADRVVLRRGDGDAAAPLDRITLQPGKPVALAVWREHLWMEGLSHPLKAGDRIPLTLTFEPGGTVEIDIIVEDMPGH